MTQPLLRGMGTQFNRIAGPLNNIGTGSNALSFGFGVYRGVVIARINSDISLADFEGNVQNQVRDVENHYRELYYWYRELDARKAGRDSSLKTWRNLDEKFRVSIKGGEKLFVAKSRAQYYQLRAQAETALWNLLNTETRLRYLMGLAPTDGRIIRPIDEPTTAKVQFDWCEVQNEALVRQVNLRKQRWQIKKSEMELIASRNFLLPQLDGVARYRLLGLGDDLLGGNAYNGTNNILGTGAYPTLGAGNFQEWDLGLTFSMTLGMRRELAAVRNKQLQLARERAILQEQELEATHMLSEAIRKMEYYHNLVQTNYNRRLAAKEEEDTAQLAVESETPIVEGVNPIDQLLEAQQRRVDAESAYYRALADYNVSVTDVHYRKGSLLEYNNVYLSEGPWPCKAYFDARKRARERDAGSYIDYGFTRPQVISEGPYEQFQGPHGTPYDSLQGEPVEGIPTPAAIPGEVIDPGSVIMESTEARVEESLTYPEEDSGTVPGESQSLRAVFAKAPIANRQYPNTSESAAANEGEQFADER
ncbi:MAG: TolC family protein [Pirellulales bacterium]